MSSFMGKRRVLGKAVNFQLMRDKFYFMLDEYHFMPEPRTASVGSGIK
jgi:hypothetical protein